ncbi:MAG TPA: hypothetical protein VFV05_08790 [Methylomirabilota bacterium]|nr:hypothetical protein [Methylomirabilota bacterium]
MTDRAHMLNVALDRDIRDDDIQPLIAAIKQLRGVIGVQLAIADASTWACRERARHELREKLWAVLASD